MNSLRNEHSLIMEFSEKQIDHLYHEINFYPHQIDGILKGKNLEETLPEGSGKATVICFDIIDSAKLGHTKYAEIFKILFQRCYELINESYDGNLSTARAFRINEVGDGFFCSVGFPLKIPRQKNIFDSAYRLSADFINALNAICLEKSINPFFAGIGRLR